MKFPRHCISIHPLNTPRFLLFPHISSIQSISLSPFTQADIFYDYNSQRMNYKIISFTVWRFTSDWNEKKTLEMFYLFISKDVLGTVRPQ